jgi:YrbI family 3-deoxy-D-manno-octulosonate 8-phosphate phosphatase
MLDRITVTIKRRFYIVLFRRTGEAKTLKLILTDIDGVLTDGHVTLDEHGGETKAICYRDLDAIGIGRQAGYDFAFVTGEDSEMACFLARRFTVERLYKGAKDKLAVLRTIEAELNIPLSNLLYIGDSDGDAPALKAVGLGIAPCDATPCAQAASDVVTQCKGGSGVLLEVVDKLISGELQYPV